MGGPTILVVQHDADDHLNELAAPLLAAGCQLELWFAPGDGEPARDAADYDGILSLGSGYGVNDEPDLPWMPAERKVMTTALAEGLRCSGSASAPSCSPASRADRCAAPRYPRSAGARCR